MVFALLTFYFVNKQVSRKKWNNRKVRLYHLFIRLCSVNVKTLIKCVKFWIKTTASHTPHLKSYHRSYSIRITSNYYHIVAHQIPTADDEGTYRIIPQLIKPAIHHHHPTNQLTAHTCYDHIASFVGSLPIHLLFNPPARPPEPSCQHHSLARWTPNPGDEGTIFTVIVIPSCAFGIHYLCHLLTYPSFVPSLSTSTHPMASVTLRMPHGHWILASSGYHSVHYPVNAWSRDGTAPCQVCGVSWGNYQTTNPVT